MVIHYTVQALTKLQDGSVSVSMIGTDGTPAPNTIVGSQTIQLPPAHPLIATLTIGKAVDDTLTTP